MTLKIITFLSSTICFIYYCILKKEEPILDKLFKRKKNSKYNSVDNNKVNSLDEKVKFTDNNSENNNVDNNQTTLTK